MSFAYDYDTAGTKPGLFNPGSSPLRPMLPQHEITGPRHAVFDSVSGISYFANDLLAVMAYSTLPMVQPAIFGPSPITWSTDHLFAAGSNASCDLYQNLISKESGTIGSVTLAAIANNTGSTLTITNVVQPEALKGYERYTAANWDGYGAEAIASGTINAARAFLRALPRVFGDPDVAPGADGTIGLEWQFTNRPLRKLFIDIGPGSVWSGFWRKTSGEHKVLPQAPIGPNIAHDLACLFKAIEA